MRVLGGCNPAEPAPRSLHATPVGAITSCRVALRLRHPKTDMRAYTAGKNLTGDVKPLAFRQAASTLPHFGLSGCCVEGKAVDIRQVGRELGVRYVLEGGVRKAGNRLRLSAQLIETENGAHLWADKLDGGLADVFDLQDQIGQGGRHRRAEPSAVGNRTLAP